MHKLLDWKFYNTDMIIKGIVQYNMPFGQPSIPTDTQSKSKSPR